MQKIDKYIAWIVVNGNVNMEQEQEEEQYAIKELANEGRLLKSIKNQTEDMCLCAVRQYPHTLQYVHNQTEAICMVAIKRNGYALQYVRDQTEAMCIEAVKENRYALKYVHNQTEAVCLQALSCINGNIDHFRDIYESIVYPSPLLIIRLRKIYPKYTDIIMTDFVIHIMQNYRTGRKAISGIAMCASDLLYRPNSIGALFSHARWQTITTNTKTLFLTT